MTGKQAREFIVGENKKYTRTHHTEHPAMMKLNWEIAYDLIKFTRDDFGEMSDVFEKEGINAFKKNKLFGMTVEIDYDQERACVEFSS